ncbi:MAG: hypothetical protein K0Q79_2348 [Flavipsychrobacter sp.]|jgi:hypothetical protein|nr:hypothetical protein [Flavipsychrobacter sp.]
MKNTLIALVTLVLAGSFVACTHKPRTYNVAADYMVIGPGGGFRPPMGTYYYLTGSQLLADTNVNLNFPPANVSGFHFTYTPSISKYDAVKNVLKEVPSELLNANHSEIGIDMQPVDGGYTIIRAKIAGTDYDWKFHDNLGNASDDVKQFMDKVRVVF